MEEKYISQLVQNLVDRFEYIGESNFDLQHEFDLLYHPVTRGKLTDSDLHEVESRFLGKIQYRRSHDGTVIIPVSMVTDPKLHEEWYNDWIAEHANDTDSYYWKRLENFLSNELTGKYGPEKAGGIVKSIDNATGSIVSKIAYPLRKEFSYKGLVVGYVQSGKTANFTALIAKAVDAGYKFVVVLAGIHDLLREQTQIRLDKELTGENDINSTGYISLPGAAKKWNRLTTANNDFLNINVSPFSTYCKVETPTLAVIKKNVHILNRLIDYISECSETLRSEIPVLVIDDEADQASIDTNANKEEEDPSGTNDCIRRLLALFHKKTYIGYTATPFANVLINMAAGHQSLQDDLYPRNFIVALPEPSGYFGTSRIFQGRLSESYVKEIDNEDRDAILRSQVPLSFGNAIEEFILCCAVRNIRGDKSKPMTMLVHVSRRIDDMRVVRELSQEYLDQIISQYHDHRFAIKLKNEFEKLWKVFTKDSLIINKELELNNLTYDFELIWNEVKSVLTKLKVVELNSRSEDQLDYTRGEEVKVIAIGGDQLSRGLTLEGLMTSYYLREAGQYDTLLQMGRWFGYRPNYEDLTRIHTTETIWGFFEHLALVEQELRSEIYRYEEEEKTPAELAVAIKSHRQLNVTARNKMGAAQMKQVSFSDSNNQTIWFPLNKPEILKRNLELGDKFIKDIKQTSSFIEHRPSLYETKEFVGVGRIISFLKEYYFVTPSETGGPGLDSIRMLEYIQRRATHSQPELTNWKVVVVGNKKPIQDNPPFTYGSLPMNRIQRSRKQTGIGYNIGVLTEPEHISLADGRGYPVLFLYMVWANSKAQGAFTDSPKPNQRIDLYRFVDSEKVDLLGLAIVFPRSASEPNSYISQ